MSLGLTHSRSKWKRTVNALVTGLTVVAAIALTAPSAAAATGQATQPAQPGGLAGSRHARPALVNDRHAGGRAISAAQRAFDASPAGKALQSGETSARASATATGKPAAVAAATTPYSLLTAEPDGTFRQVTTLQPARYQQAGRWVGISTTLHRTPAGIAPVSVPGQVTLSSGGAGPAAAITTAAGTRATLTVPYTLSDPVIAGPAATYRTSVPGLTLTLTATPQGGVSEAVTRGATGARPGIASGAAARGAAALAGTWTTPPAAPSSRHRPRHHHRRPHHGSRPPRRVRGG